MSRSRRAGLHALGALLVGRVLAACGASETATSAATATVQPIATNTPALTESVQATATPPSEESMAIRYTRSGGRTPPRDREILAIDANGAYMLWRSVANASNPPSPVGRFGGSLAAKQRDSLNERARKAVAAGDLSIRPRPDSPVETIEIDGAKARLGAYDEPEAPWGPLIAQLRALLGELTATPISAIALDVDPDGMAARLVQRGPETIRLDLGGLTVRAVLWKDDEKLGDWRASGAGGPEQVSAGPGWSYDLPFAHGFSVAPGQAVVAYVTCVAYDAAQAVPVALSSPRRPSDQ